MTGRVLMASWLFPPSRSIGAKRAYRFARYLPSHGWAPTVVCRRAVPASQRDEGPHALPPEVTLRPEYDAAVFARFAGTSSASPGGAPQPLARGWRARASERWGLFVDAVWPTETEAIHAPHLLRVLDAQMPAHDALWTTSYPYHTHAVGALVARRHRAPWVVDLRDPWTPNWVHRRKYGHARAVESWLERAVFDRADAIVLTCDALTELYREMFPRLASRFVTIHNAYDPADAPGDVARDAAGPVRLVHFGNVYGPWSLSTALRALASLRASGEIPPRGVVLENYGKMSDRDRDEARALGLGDVVQVRGALSYAEGVASLRRADALLLAAWNDPDARLYIQGKLYDYLLAGRDVIAETGHAEVRAMVAGTGAGCAVAPGDVAEMTSRLRRVLRGQRVTDEVRDEARVRHWSAPEATRRLAALLDDVRARRGARDRP